MSATPESGREAKPQKTQETVSFVAPCGHLLEVTFDAARKPRLQFAVGDGKGGKVCMLDTCTNGGVTFVPPADRMGLLDKGVVLLPSCASDYGSQDGLLVELRDFIHRYADVPEFWEELIAHYVLMTWVYDKFTAVPYLRFLGEPGTGKTRLLQIAVYLSYKGISGGGSTTASPLFRLLDVYHGTFAIDEADYKNSELWSDIIKILNEGYMRGLHVLRSSKRGDDYDPCAFDVYGPKILSTRREFEDCALETRCLTLRTEERKIRADIPRQLPEAFHTEALALRNKLLRWRFKSWAKVASDESKLLGLEPRLTQIGAPLYSISCDEGFRAEFLGFLGEQAEDQRSERPQVLVVEAIQSLLQHVSRWPIMLGVKEVAEAVGEVGDAPLTPKRAGALLRSLGFKPQRTRTGYEVEVTRAKLSELVGRYQQKTGAVDES
jgi:hypothetical protein